MLRLFPLPAAERPTDAVYADLAWPAPPATRPYVALNMVTTVDGRAAIAGKASGIGTATDRVLMRQLRAHADAVLVGVGTLRAEALTPAVPQGYTAARLARGQSAQPLGVLVSNSGRLPLERHYFEHTDYARVLLTGAAGAAGLDPRAAAGLRVIVAGTRRVDLPAALATLRTELGVRWVLCEGGPTLNRALLAADLVDELFLTLAPKLAAGPALTILAGRPLPGGAAVSLRLLALHADGDELYLRYQVAAERPAAP